MKLSHFSTSLKLTIGMGTLIASTVFNGCNSTTTTTVVNNMVSSLVGTVSTDANKDVWTTISTELRTSEYGLASLNLPIVDPNTGVVYGLIHILPTVLQVQQRPVFREANLQYR